MRKSQNIILALGVTALIILLNVLAAHWAGQADLTFDKRYTLAPATKSVLSRLTDPVTIKAYFTAELPPPYSTTSIYVQDLLDQFYSQSKGQVHYQFIDPAQVLDAEDEEARKEVQHDLFGRPVRPQTKLEHELSQKGIMPARIRVNDNDKLEERRVYLGLELIYGENTEVIPLVQDVGQLEYNITALIRKMSRPAAPKIGFITGHNGPDANNGVAKFMAAISGQFETVQLDLTAAEATIADDIALLVIMGPKTAFSDHEIKQLDHFIQSGRGAAFLLDSLDVNLEDFSSTQLNSGLSSLLASYGFTISEGIVGDAQGASIGVQQRQGFLVVNQPVKYYYMPLVLRYPQGSPISAGLGPIALAYNSSLEVSNPALQVIPILESSKEAWLEPLNNIYLSPMQDWTNREINFSPKPLTMALAASGRFPSPFGHENQNSRLALFGGSYFLDDQFIQESGVSLMLNTFDWLTGDDELLAMRNRGLAFALIDEGLSPAHKNFIKYSNIFGGPFALVVIGLFLWRRRESKRKRLQTTN